MQYIASIHKDTVQNEKYISKTKEVSHKLVGYSRITAITTICTANKYQHIYGHIIFFSASVHVMSKYQNAFIIFKKNGTEFKLASTDDTYFKAEVKLGYNRLGESIAPLRKHINV